MKLSRLTATACALGLVFATLSLAGGISAQAAGSYRTLAAANIRAGTNTSTAILQTVPRGAVITIDCYLNGQVITGTPIWDHLVSGGYMSDSLLLTGSSSAVVPLCGAPTPPPAASSATRAVAWGVSQNHSNAYPFLCERFVENAYGTSGRYASAIAGFYALRAAGQMHYTSTGIPAGALVFSSNPRYDLSNGHVMISIGNGTYISGGVSGSGGTVQIIGLQSTFLGWSMAPASWPGR
jgi:hypothetical protein